MIMKEDTTTSSLGFFLAKSSRILTSKTDHLFKKAGLPFSFEQWMVLSCLNEKGGQSQQALSNLTGRDKTTMTRMINGLQKRNLVLRVPGKFDKRNKQIYLTQKGSQVYQELNLLATRVFEHFTKDLDEKDVDLCKNILQKTFGLKEQMIDYE